MSMGPEKYEVEHSNRLVVATPFCATMTETEAEELLEGLRQHLRNDNAIHFVVDMQHVDFLASDALGYFVMFCQDLRDVRGKFAFAACRPNIEFLFKVTCLDMVCTLCEDLDEAQIAVQ